MAYQVAPARARQPQSPNQRFTALVTGPLGRQSPCRHSRGLREHHNTSTRVNRKCVPCHLAACKAVSRCSKHVLNECRATQENRCKCRAISRFLSQWTWRWSSCSSVHASQTMWKMCPIQSGSLQGLHSAKSVDLAGSLPGIGSGWQQSKQDWGLPAVMGEHV